MPSPRPPEVLGGPDSLADLTPQQREIVRLAGSGLTNREIADRLFLSPRTASSHLYRSYPKLRVKRSRVSRQCWPPARIRLHRPPAPTSSGSTCPPRPSTGFAHQSRPCRCASRPAASWTPRRSSGPRTVASVPPSIPTDRACVERHTLLTRADDRVPPAVLTGPGGASCVPSGPS
jgi:DNA-binding CsgD family transcriptional regulator